MNELVVELLVFHTFKDLMVPIKASMKTIMGTPPQALAQFDVVLPPLSGGPKETQAAAQRY